MSFEVFLFFHFRAIKTQEVVGAHLKQQMVEKLMIFSTDWLPVLLSEVFEYIIKWSDYSISHELLGFAELLFEIETNHI